MIDIQLVICCLVWACMALCSHACERRLQTAPKKAAKYKVYLSIYQKKA